MRTLAIVFIALVISSTLAVQSRAPSFATIKKIEKLRENKKSWSSIIINLAFLTAKSGNPLDQLIEAINKVVADIQNKVEEENNNFDILTGEHNAEVKRLNREIDSANSDIARTQTFLSEVLYVMKATLEREIVELAAQIESTKKFLAEAAVTREQEHNDFLARVLDAQGGIEAVNEAWTVLSELLEGSTSLAQVNKVKSKFAKVQKKLSSKSIDQTIVKALLQLSTDFSDQKLVRQVLDAMNDVRESLKNAVEKFTAEEEQAQNDYNTLVAEKNLEIRNYEAATIEKKGQLAATERRIEINEAFVAQRQADLADFLGALVTENRNYEIATAAHEDLLAELEKENHACGEALDILKSAEFSGYLADRLNNAGSLGVIGTHADTGRADIKVTGF